MKSFRQRISIIALLILTALIVAWWLDHARAQIIQNNKAKAEAAAAAAYTAALAFQPTACQTNLFLLDTAITRWANNTQQSTTNFPTDKDLQPYFPDGIIPHCPDGLPYHYGTRALATECPHHGHAILPMPARVHTKPSLLESIMDKFGLIPHPPHYDCLPYLKYMDGAAQQWALENKKTDSDTIPPLEIAKYLKNGRLPYCYEGGKYYFTTVSNPPYCTITGHSLP